MHLYKVDRNLVAAGRLTMGQLVGGLAGAAAGSRTALDFPEEPGRLARARARVAEMRSVGSHRMGQLQTVAGYEAQKYLVMQFFERGTGVVGVGLGSSSVRVGSAAGQIYPHI